MTLREVAASQTKAEGDTPAQFEVIEHRHLWDGRVIGLEEDEVRLIEDAEPVLRQYTTHPGAVAVVALRGEAGNEEVLLERQYRHPVRANLWEIPAGLLDIEGEDYVLAAQRELAEEVDLQANQWDVLVDYFTSPGGSVESLRIFLARDLVELDQEFERLDEEALMVSSWVKLDDAVDMIFSGKLHNPSAVTGILATWNARARGWKDLRPADSPWMR